MATVMVVVFAARSFAQETATYFKQNCATCHTIGGGRLTGPDLKDVSKNKDREWLQAWIVNPQSKINAGDSYALKLLEESRGVVMPVPPGITQDLAGKLLDLIDAESALPTSQFRGLQISNAPFTPADIARGEAIFRGEQRLKNGGPACMSCHATTDIKGLGGGRLGPDLTRVYERLQGRAGLSAWLVSPGTMTMRALFEKHSLEPGEITALAAFFEKQSQMGAQTAPTSQLNFLLYGLGGSVLGLTLLDRIWRGRLRGIRRPLTHQKTSRGMA